MTLDSKPHRILVTGAAGTLGLRLVRGLKAQGKRVRALVMPGDALAQRLVGVANEIREGDITRPESLLGLCDDIDTVFHMAAVIISADPTIFARVNRDGTANMIVEAERAGVRHFVYISSASVTYPLLTAYAQSKLDAEHLLKACPGVQHTIIRPTLVYDEQGGQEFVMFLNYLRSFPVVPFIGPGNALKRPVWSEDIVQGLLKLVDNPICLGKTYNYSGGEAISILALAQLMLLHHGDARLFVRLPVPLCSAIASALTLLVKRPRLTHSAIAGLINDANLDPSEATRDLGYEPLGVHAGFQKCFPLIASPGATISRSTPSTSPQKDLL